MHLVIPKRKVASYFDLTDPEILSLFHLSQKYKAMVDTTWHLRQENGESLPKQSGYNVAFNVDEGGGQTVPQVHMHVIPRYKGDLGKDADGNLRPPTGGIRAVMQDPAKINWRTGPYPAFDSNKFPQHIWDIYKPYANYSPDTIQASKFKAEA